MLKNNSRSTVINSFLGILTIAGIIIFNFLRVSLVSAGNTNKTFRPFKASDYTKEGPALSPGDEAKQIAYYSNYILPIISEQENGCLGSRPYDPTILQEDKLSDSGSPRLFLVNRCSHLHASDYARLNYIIALNANLARDDTTETALRYVSNEDNPNYEYEANAEIPMKATITKDDDTSHIYRYVDKSGIADTITFGLGPKYLKVNTVLPSASDNKITRKELPIIFVPGVNLLDSDSAAIFGFNKGDADKDYRPIANDESGYGYTPYVRTLIEYKNMYTNVINYAMRDCVQSGDSSVSVPRDKVANDRAILLSRIDLLGEQVNKRIADAEDCKAGISQQQTNTVETAPVCFDKKLDENLLAKAWSEHIKQPGGWEVQTEYEKNKAQVDSEIKSFHKTFMAKYKEHIGSSAAACIKNGLTTTFLFTTECTGISKLELTTMIAEHSYTYAWDDRLGLLKREFDSDIYDNLTIGSGIANRFLLNIQNAIKSCYSELNLDGDGGGQTNTDVEQNKEVCNEIYGLPTKSDKPSCATLVAILKQTDYETEAEYFINTSTKVSDGPKWLPLTEEEKLLMNYGSDLSHNIGGNSVTFHPKQEPKSTCFFTGFSSIICTFTNFVAHLSDSAFYLVESFLEFPAELLNPEGGSVGHNLYTAWSTFRDVANIVLSIMLLLVVMSQVTGWQIDKWGLKRNLPKIIVAAVLINLSFTICQVVVDLSNLIGAGIYDLLKSGANSLLQVPVTDGLAGQSNGSVWAQITFAALAAAGFMIVVLNLIVLAPTVIAALVTAIMSLLILALRQVFIVVLILSAPIVFALAATSATEALSKRWWKILFSILIAYPMISLAFGVGNLVYGIVSTANYTPGGMSSSLFSILSTYFLFLPLTLIPAAMKKSIQNLPFIGSQLNNLTQKLSGQAQKATEKTKLVTSTKAHRAQRKKIRSFKMAQKLGRFRIPGTAIFRDLDLNAQVDQEWLKNIRDKKYTDPNNNPINGEDNVNQIRVFNAGGEYRPDDVMAAMLTAAEEGKGYFEDILIAANKLSHQVEPEKLAVIMDEVATTYRDNGRTEVMALLKHARLNTQGTYQFTRSANDPHQQVVDGFNRTIASSSTPGSPPSKADIKAGYSKVVQRAMVGSGGINYSKFTGIDTNNDANTRAGSYYRNDIIKSSGYSRDAIQDLVATNKPFAEEVRENIPAKSEARSFFENDLGHRLWGP